MRWTTEVAYHDCKQLLDFGKCQSVHFSAQIASFTLTMMQYNILCTVKRFEAYETIGALFRETTRPHVDVGNQAEPALLVIGLGGIHAVALDILVTLGAIGRIGVVGVLNAVCAHLLLVAQGHLAVRHLILLVEHPTQKQVVGALDANEHPVDDSTEDICPPLDLLACGAVFRLLGILLAERLDLLPQRGIQAVQTALCPLLERGEDDALAGVAGNVAANELAVHAD